MHFPIIRLESLEANKADFERYLPDDPCLNGHTDYYGDLYSKERRKETINAPWLKDLIDGIATLDTEKETITILDAETARKTFKDYLRKVTKQLHEEAEEGKLDGFTLRMAGDEYKGYSTLFYYNYGFTSFDFAESADYHAGETFKIGNIFDAHF